MQTSELQAKQGLSNSLSERESGDSSPRILDRWARHLRSVEELSPASVRKYCQALERLARAGSQPLEDVDGAALAAHKAWMASAGYAASTQRQAVAAIRAFYGWAEDEGLVDRSPARRLRGPRPVTKPRSRLTQGETVRLLYGEHPGSLPRDPWKARDRVMVTLGYFLGLRVSEVGRLRVGEVEMTERGGYSFLVRSSKRGGWKRREVVDLIAVQQVILYLTLREQIESAGMFLFPSQQRRPISDRQCQRILKRRLKESDIRRRGRSIGWHILRHTRADDLLREGWQLADVAAWLRQSRKESALPYLHARDDERLGQVMCSRRRLDAPKPGQQGLWSEIARILGPHL